MNGKCPHCGYDESQEALDKVMAINILQEMQCMSCKSWTNGGFVGSYCGNPIVNIRYTSANCPFFEDNKVFEEGTTSDCCDAPIEIFTPNGQMYVRSCSKCEKVLEEDE